MPPAPDATDEAPYGAPSDGLPARLVAMVGALRDKGIPCGTSETVDAARVAQVLGLDDRGRLREGLAAALVRRGGQRAVFDAVFDLYFPAGVGATQGTRDGEDDLPADPGDRVERLREELRDALVTRDAGALEAVAERAVDALGRVGVEGNRTFSALQTLERLRPQTLVASVVQERGGDDAGDLGDRLVRDEVRRDVERLKTLVASAARRRAAELRGRERMATYAVPDPAERQDFLTTNLTQFAALRAAVRPLSRKLATRLAARRRAARRGEVDVRRTLRRSMSTGGVPIRLVHRRPRPSRPELVLLCDVSGSVAGFSGFTMLLVRALADQFTRVRVLAFVNVTDEVTHLVQEGRPDLVTAIQREARVTGWHGSSDYGEALGDVAETYLEAIGPRTAVLVLGDGRTNYGDPNLVALQRIRDRSRRTFWLNPEPRARWGTGDSCADEYARVVEMHECRTIEQLSRFITHLLPV